VDSLAHLVDYKGPVWRFASEGEACSHTGLNKSTTAHDFSRTAQQVLQARAYDHFVHVGTA
jgi:hypothetical protein